MGEACSGSEVGCLGLARYQIVQNLDGVGRHLYYEHKMIGRDLDCEREEGTACLLLLSEGHERGDVGFRAQDEFKPTWRDTLDLIQDLS